MAVALNPSLVVPIGFGALILWRFYYRMRRLIGRQKLSKVRPWLTVSILPLVALLLASLSMGRPMSLLALGAGLVAGIGLGVYGLRVTRFEETPEGLFYTPSAHVGIALSLLLAGRILYRQFQLYEQFGSPPITNAAYATTPLTLLIFGTLAGYYVTYAIGLLRWRSSTVTR